MEELTLSPELGDEGGQPHGCVQVEGSAGARAELGALTGLGSWDPGVRTASAQRWEHPGQRACVPTPEGLLKLGAPCLPSPAGPSFQPLDSWVWLSRCGPQRPRRPPQ